MSDIRIIRSWDSLPPVVSAEGEHYSTRALAKQYMDTRDVAFALLEYIDAIPEEAAASFPAMPGVDRDWVDEVLGKKEKI